MCPCGCDSRRSVAHSPCRLDSATGRRGTGSRAYLTTGTASGIARKPEVTLSHHPLILKDRVLSEAAKKGIHVLRQAQHERKIADDFNTVPFALSLSKGERRGFRPPARRPFLTAAARSRKLLRF